jgi:hypothetical protein
MPEYWCRVENDGTYYLFIAQPLAKNLSYPLYSGQSYMKELDYRTLTLHVNGKTIQQTITFNPYQSLLLKIMPDGQAEFQDITFTPKDPIVRPREPQKTYF